MVSLRFTASEWRVILIFAAAVGIGMADAQWLNPLTPEIDAYYGFEESRSFYLLVSYFIGAAIAAAVAGPGSDLWGRRVFFLGGVGIAAIADLFCYFVEPFWGIVLLRLFVGMGIGTCALTYLAYMGDLFPYERRGLAMGLVTVGFFAGMTFGPLTAAAIAHQFGWKIVFLILATCSGIVFAISLWGLPKVHKHKTAKGGLRGVLREWMGFHTQRGTLLVLLAFACLSASAFAFNTFVSYWLEAVYRITPTQRSWVFIYVGLGTLIASPIAGWMADRFGKISTSYYSSWAIGILILLIPFVPALPGFFGRVGLIMFGAVLIGGFVGIRTTPVLALVTQVVPQHQRGNFLALKSVWTYIGIAVALKLGGEMYNSTLAILPETSVVYAKEFLSQHLSEIHVSDNASRIAMMESFFGFVSLGLFAGGMSVVTAVLLGWVGKIPGVEQAGNEDQESEMIETITPARIEKAKEEVA